MRIPLFIVRIVIKFFHHMTRDFWCYYQLQPEEISLLHATVPQDIPLRVRRNGLPQIHAVASCQQRGDLLRFSG